MTRAVIIREPNWKTAYKLVTFGPDIIEQVLELPTGTIATLDRATTCPCCKVEPDEPCVTRSGKKAARPHKHRRTATLACLISIMEEPVIVEEAEITD